MVALSHLEAVQRAVAQDASREKPEAPEWPADGSNRPLRRHRRQAFSWEHLSYARITRREDIARRSLPFRLRHEYLLKQALNRFHGTGICFCQPSGHGIPFGEDGLKECLPVWVRCLAGHRAGSVEECRRILTCKTEILPVGFQIDLANEKAQFLLLHLFAAGCEVMACLIELLLKIPTLSELRYKPEEETDYQERDASDPESFLIHTILIPSFLGARPIFLGGPLVPFIFLRQNGSWIGSFISQSAMPSATGAHSRTLEERYNTLVNRRFAILAMASLAAGWAAMREVKGTVSDQNGRKLVRAVVYLKNTRTMVIRSYISRQNGSYRFSGLNADIDYELWARFQGVTSATKALSRFDSDKTAIVDLVVELKP